MRRSVRGRLLWLWEVVVKSRAEGKGDCVGRSGRGEKSLWRGRRRVIVFLGGLNVVVRQEIG